MKEEKNNYGILILFIFLIITVVGVYIYYQNYKDINPIKKTEENKIVHEDEEINSLYDGIKFSYETEGVLTKNDLEKMEKGYSVGEFSNELIITYGLIHLDIKDIGHEANYRAIVDKDGYRYNGTYVKASLVKGHVNQILGSGVTYIDTNVFLTDTRYYYYPSIKCYKIFKKNYNKTIDKVTYIDADWDEENIYITEYSAYTYKTPTRYNSFSKHQNPLPIGITNDNIKENLDIIDKYKYTFKYNKSTENYYLNKIEYIK